MFGIACAPELFQRIMEMILSGCENCFNYIDDIIIYADNKEQLEAYVNKVLERLKSYNVLLNHEKCIFNAEQLTFLGHKLSATGIEPTDDKIAAIKMFRQPKTAEEIRSFLGLVNYIGKFIANLATLTEPLRKLTKKDTKFEWCEEQQKAFDELKTHLSSHLVLGYYDVKDRTQLYADASPVGLGAVLIQFNNDQPRVISYASKSLSETEMRYCQTEKEALALVWAAERFHFYLYGRSFELVTNHKPLEVIFSPTSKPCARIERWVLRLQSYKYQVVYKPGKTNIADPLSRLPDFEPTNESFDEITEHHVNSITTFAAPVAIQLKDIEECSLADATIKAVKDALYHNKWSELAKPFKMFETELCFSGNILLRGTKIVMPETLRARTLELAHEGHPGITKMKQRLRTKVWWPKIDSEAETCVKRRHGCTMVAAPPPPEPMNRKELPNEPWQHIAIDYLGPLPSGDNLLVVVDYFSRFIEIEIMKKIDSFETIKRLRVIFARFGYPLTITADNGRQFISEEFKRFCTERNIQLISTTPYWPQQNGEVERQNRSILKRLIISQNTQSDWKKDLLEYLHMYRSTPHSTTMRTPSELMFGRNIRDKIPQIHQSMEVDNELKDRDASSKERGKLYADQKRHAKTSEIMEGDEVWLKVQLKSNKFEPSPYKVVERKGPELLVENIQTKVRYRRNVAHAIRINELKASTESDSPSTLSTQAPANSSATLITNSNETASNSSQKQPADNDATSKDQRPKRHCAKPNRYST